MTRRMQRRGVGGGMPSSIFALAMITLLASCSSTGTGESPRVVTPVAPMATATAPSAVNLTSIDVREGAPGMQVDLVADAAIVWTSYRDADGALVIELPNTVPAAQVVDHGPEGVIAGIQVRQETSADRPFTRLTVHGQGEFEYSLASEGSVLQLRIVPADSVVETNVEPAQPTPSVASPGGVPAPSSTADVAPSWNGGRSAPALLQPDLAVAGPAPQGALASRLEGVEQLATPGTFRLIGDGEFAYTVRRLTAPERFVIDLEGVSNHSSRSTIAVTDPQVVRVRVAQFKARPEAVARVVFDLGAATPATLERDAWGMTIRFGSAAVDSTAPIAVPQAMADDENTTPNPVDDWSEPAPQTVVAPLDESPVVVDAYSEPPPIAPAPAPAAPVPVAAPEVPAYTPPPAYVAPPPVSVTTPVSLFEAAEVEAEPAIQAASTAERRPVLQVFGARTVGGVERTYAGEPITLTLRDNDIVEVLRAFAEISNLNIVIQPGVAGPVTVELKSVPWDQALEQILKIHNLGAELEGNILRIAPVAQLRAEAEEQQRLVAAQALSIPLKTVIKRLSYATATDIAAILQRQGSPGAGGSLMSQRGSVTVDARTNTLLIKELPEYMDTVIAVIEELDTPEPQVMIEARIVETTRNFSRSLGIQWNFDAIASAATGNTTGLVFPNNVDAAGGVNLLTGGNAGLLGITLGNVLNTFTLDATLQAAENEGLINILSTPKVATLNNQSAEIQSGLQIPIQTVANNTVTVQFVNATLRLLVTPHVTAEGTVMMDINVQKREPLEAFLVVGAGNAPISTKEARTRVIVRDGGTTVIGGIYRVSANQGQNRVPGLANIPILGHLFKNRTRSNQNEELLIFITPRVIKL